MSAPITCPRCHSTRVEIMYRSADVLVCACGVCHSQFSTFPAPAADVVGRDASKPDKRANDASR